MTRINRPVLIGSKTAADEGLNRVLPSFCGRTKMKILFVFTVLAHLSLPVLAEYKTDDLVLYMDSRRPGPRPYYNIDPVNGNMPSWEGLRPYFYIAVIPIHMTDFNNLPDWVTGDSFGGMAYHHFKFESNNWGARITRFSDSETNGTLRFNYSDDFTVEMWVRPIKSSLLAEGRMHLFGDQTVGGQGYRLTAKDEGNRKFLIEFEMQDVTGKKARYFCSTAADFNMDQWYQIAGVYAGTDGAAPVMKIYVNGVDQNASFEGDTAVPEDTDFIPDEAGISPVLLTGIGARGRGDNGVYSDSARQYFGGDLSVVRLYTNVLTSTEVSLNYSNELPRFSGEIYSWLPDPDFHTNAVPEYKLWTNGIRRSQMQRLPADRRVTIASNTNHYLCRADVLQTGGGRLICAFLENSTHEGSETNGYSSVAVSVSDDNGYTWHDPNITSRSYGIICYGRVNVENYIHGVVNISWHPDAGSNGAAVINTTTIKLDTTLTNRTVHTLFWSYDEGRTWTTQFLENVTSPSNVEPDRIRTLANGDLVILGHIGRRPASFLVPKAPGEETLIRSKDGGQTWLAVPDLVQSQNHLSWHESSLLDTGNGRLVVFMDDMSGHAYPSFRCYSEDSGHNFGMPVMAPWFGQKNESDLLASGKVLTTFRTHGTEEGYTAWLGDAYEANDIMPVTSFCYEPDRIRLYPDRLTLDSGEGNFKAAMYTLPPAADPSDRIVFKTRMRCLSADMQACHIDVGLPIMIYTNRMELLTNSTVGFDVDATQWHDYEIDRNGSNLVIKCDGQIRVDADVGAYVKNSQLNGDPVGRTVKFGNYTYGFGHEKFSKNTGTSEWQSVEVTVVSGFFPSYHWQWSAASGVYPDQYKRDRLIMLEPEGSDWSTDYGYGGWTQLKDGSIYVVDYTRGEESSVPKKPFIRGYRLYESDFDSVKPTNALLYLEAADPGADAANVWKPVSGSGGTLCGTNSYKPYLGADGNIPCYRFDCAAGSGGQVGGLSVGRSQFDYDEDFTIEVWIKPEKSIAATGRMHVIGNQLAGEANSACGWRLTARQVSGTDQFFLELNMRDNAGTNATNKATYQVRTAGTYTMGWWHHITAVYDGISNAVPMMHIYVDGQASGLIAQSDSWVPPADERSFTMPYQEITVGARGRPGVTSIDEDRQWLGGWVAMVRLYSGVLDNEQIKKQRGEDLDEDGYSAWQEFMTNTDPYDSASRLGLRFTSLGTLGFESSFQCAYTVEYNDNLVSNSWKSLSSVVRGSGWLMNISETNDAPRRFYRLKASLWQ